MSPAIISSKKMIPFSVSQLVGQIPFPYKLKVGLVNVATENIDMIEAQIVVHWA